VLAGRLRFRLGDEKRVVGAEDGEMVVAPGVTHGIVRRRERKGCSRRAGHPGRPVSTQATVRPSDRVSLRSCTAGISSA
jgi:hypothetical protein